MRDVALYRALLGLTAPWTVAGVDVDMKGQHIARARRVVRGYRLRVDTPVVETNIHYPTASSLLADGVRVLTAAQRPWNWGRRFSENARTPSW